MTERQNIRRMQTLEREKTFDPNAEIERIVAPHMKALIDASAELRKTNQHLALYFAGSLQSLFPNADLGVPYSELVERRRQLEALRKGGHGWADFTEKAVYIQRIFGKEALDLREGDYRKMFEDLENRLSGLRSSGLKAPYVAMNIRELFPDKQLSLPEAEIRQLISEARSGLASKNYVESARALRKLKVLYPAHGITVSQEDWKGSLEHLKLLLKDRGPSASAAYYADDLKIASAEKIRFGNRGIELVPRQKPALRDTVKEIPVSLKLKP